MILSRDGWDIPSALEGFRITPGAAFRDRRPELAAPYHRIRRFSDEDLLRIDEAASHQDLLLALFEQARRSRNWETMDIVLRRLGMVAADMPRPVRSSTQASR